MTAVTEILTTLSSEKEERTGQVSLLIDFLEKVRHFVSALG